MEYEFVTIRSYEGGDILPRLTDKTHDSLRNALVDAGWDLKFASPRVSRLVKDGIEISIETEHRNDLLHGGVG